MKRKQATHFKLENFALHYEAGLEWDYRHTHHLPDLFWTEIGIFIVKSYINVLWGRVLLIEAARLQRLAEWD